jgi:hypothetical protein
MAQIIHWNKEIEADATAGERRLAQILKRSLDDDCWIWYNVPMGKKRLHPDFVILHPSRGLLFLEVKDWKPERLKRLTKTEATLLTEEGETRVVDHPLQQVRKYALEVTNLFEREPQLCHPSGKYQGKLIFRYDFGIILANITRKQIEEAVSKELRDVLLPDHAVIYKGEFADSTPIEEFQRRLWGMFMYDYGVSLTQAQIDRIRARIYPDTLIGIRNERNHPKQEKMILPTDDSDGMKEYSLKDVIRIMDRKQELTALNLPRGHHTIHGPAGSGKTMILIHLCRSFAEKQIEKDQDSAEKQMEKPILVLCFNISLAAFLRHSIFSKDVSKDKIQVYHFHEWCGQQIKDHSLRVPSGDGAFYDRQVVTLINAVNNGDIPTHQYGAVLIDEVHDMKKEWLEVIVRMFDPESKKSLLLLYDGAQNIYTKKGKGFRLSDVGIDTSGGRHRTTILDINYRNTLEIMNFAYRLTEGYLPQEIPKKGDAGVDMEDGHSRAIPFGVHGPAPVVKWFNDFDTEMDYVKECILQWLKEGVPLSSIGVLCPYAWQGNKLSGLLRQHDIPHQWLGTQRAKKAFDPAMDAVTVLMIPSSKGLEFDRVILTGIGSLKFTEEEEDSYHLLYVGITRAREYLQMCCSGSFAEQLFDKAKSCIN